MTKIIDRNNIDFLVFDVFKLRELLGRGRYADHDTESMAILSPWRLAVEATTESINDKQGSMSHDDAN